MPVSCIQERKHKYVHDIKFVLYLFWYNWLASCTFYIKAEYLGFVCRAVRVSNAVAGSQGVQLKQIVSISGSRGPLMTSTFML